MVKMISGPRETGARTDRCEVETTVLRPNSGGMIV
jgi:hypothetical protein